MLMLSNYRLDMAQTNQFDMVCWTRGIVSFLQAMHRNNIAIEVCSISIITHDSGYRIIPWPSLQRSHLSHSSAWFFLQIRLPKNFWLISSLTEFYETNKIRLNQAKYIHIPTTNLPMGWQWNWKCPLKYYNIKRKIKDRSTGSWLAIHMFA